MPHKDPEAKREYMRRRYREKAEEIKEYQRQYRHEHQDEIKTKRRPYQRGVYLKNRVVRRLAFILRAGGRCMDCGLEEIACLHFHHRDESTKEFELGRALNSGAKMKYPIDMMLAELEKCDLLCANCHTLRHNTWTDDERENMIQLAQDYFAGEV